MPHRLMTIIAEDPAVRANRAQQCVQVDVKACGVVVTVVGMSPYIALRLGEALQLHALAMLSEPNEVVVPIKRGRKKRGA